VIMESTAREGHVIVWKAFERLRTVSAHERLWVGIQQPDKILYGFDHESASEQSPA
jgi:hypothetical protein